MIFLKLIAHRGLRSQTIKENTIEAFQNAIENKNCAGFEFDIRKTKDNQFIVCHNAFVKKDWIKKKNARYLQKKYHLPLLEEVLALQTTKLFLIEIKDAQIPYTNLLKIINKYQDKNLYITSFHNKVIEQLKEKKIPAKLGILNYIVNSKEEYPYDFICLLNSLTTLRLVEEYQKRNIQLFFYGILNEKKDLWYQNGFYIVDKID